MEPSDDEDLAALMLDAYAGTIDADGSETIEMAATEIANWRAGDAGAPRVDESVVAVGPDDRLVGACLVSRWQDRPLIAYQMTASNSKGQGVARALLAETLTRLAAAGELEAVLFVTRGNAPAERVYESLGFVDAERPAG